MKLETVLPNGKTVMVEENAIDRAVRFVSPSIAEERLKSRLRMAVAGMSYNAASTTRAGMKHWTPKYTDPDSNIFYDLPAMRARSRDIVRNNPIGGGAINTVVTNVVGRGITMRSTIDAEVLKLSDEEADAWEDNTEREFALWAESKDADITRSLDFYEQQDLIFRQTLENGDTFILKAWRDPSSSPYGLRTQIIEADRVCNKQLILNGPLPGDPNMTLAFGVKKDPDGAPVSYFIANRHPYSIMDMKKLEWQEVPAFSIRTNRRQVLHLYRMLRPGQSRGVPYLAPVIETLKQIARYTEAELQAAVVAGLFTVFIKSELDADLAVIPTENSTVDDTTDEVKLGPGAVAGLSPGESIETANPGRPNNNFYPFVEALCEYVGMALEIPKEILMKRFLASYSASRAALQEAWKFFIGRRVWLIDNYCKPVYEWWLDEAVAIGRISAPGYFTDPIIRQAYLGTSWTGPAKGMIQEQQEVGAAIERMQSYISPLSEETAQLTGGDWDMNLRQIIKERRALMKSGLIANMTDALKPSVKNPKGDVNPEETDTGNPANQGGKENARD